MKEFLFFCVVRNAVPASVCTMVVATDGRRDRTPQQFSTTHCFSVSEQEAGEGLLWVASFSTAALRRTEIVVINNKILQSERGYLSHVDSAETPPHGHCAGV